MLASSSEDGTSNFWEMKEGKQVKSWTAHASGALCVSYAHDGRLASCGRDNAVVLWDANGGKTRAMNGSVDLPLRSAFTSDGERIVGTDFAGHVNVWTCKDGKSRGELDANPAPLAEQLAAAQKRVKECETAIKLAATNKDSATNAAVAADKSATNSPATTNIASAAPAGTNVAAAAPAGTNATAGPAGTNATAAVSVAANPATNSATATHERRRRGRFGKEPG